MILAHHLKTRHGAQIEAIPDRNHGFFIRLRDGGGGWAVMRRDLIEMAKFLVDLAETLPKDPR